MMKTVRKFLIAMSMDMALLVLANAATVASAQTPPTKLESQGNNPGTQGAGGPIAVKRGDTLDRLIARHLPSHPIRPEILRQEIVSQNPDAFKGGKANALVAGASLWLPGLSYFRDKYFQASDKSTGKKEDSRQNADSVQGETSADDIDPRKGWVRFP